MFYSRPSPRDLSQAFMKGADGLGSLRNRTALQTFFGQVRVNPNVKLWLQKKLLYCGYIVHKTTLSNHKLAKFLWVILRFQFFPNTTHRGLTSQLTLNFRLKVEFCSTKTCKQRKTSPYRNLMYLIQRIFLQLVEQSCFDECTSEQPLVKTRVLWSVWC